MVLEHLGHSMAQLAPPQRFSVVFFKTTKRFPCPILPRCHWPLQITSVRPFGGCTKRLCLVGDPTRALEMALAIQPDVIFLLSENITGAGPFEIELTACWPHWKIKIRFGPMGHEHSHQVRSILEEDVLGVLETNRQGPWWTRRLQLCGA